jgi:hypothetical protein
MPVVIEQPRLLHPTLTALPTAAGVALIAVTGILKAPSDQPNLPTVISNVLLCLNAVLARVPHMGSALNHLKRELEAAVKPLARYSGLDQPGGMIGRINAHRAWALLASNLNHAPLSLLEAIGIEFARAYLTNSAFSPGPATDLHRLQAETVDGAISQEKMDWLENYVLSQLNRTQHVFVDRAAGLDARTTCFNAQVVASVTAQKSSMRIEQRQAAGRIMEMTEAELKEVFAALRMKIENGDAHALQAALAYFVGLTWELTLDVPFFSGRQCPSVVWINPADGCVYVDMARMLQGLSKKQADRHVPTNLLLVRPLPTLIADLVQSACAASPGLETVGSLCDDGYKVSRSILPGCDTGSAIRASIARLITSRAGVALRAGLGRDLAAYASLSLSLVSSSDHHYLIKQRAEIWVGCEKISRSLDWGPCVPDPDSEGAAFGSRVTAEMSWMKDLVEELRTVAIQLRPGKRYGINALIQHHNSFARYVALLMTIMVGGRTRKHLDFCASDWREHYSFGQHGDKLVGPTSGLTPLPISATSSSQIRLWRSHLRALDQRMEKLAFPDEHATRVWIGKILVGEKVDLLFTLSTEALPGKFATATLFQGEGKSMNWDFARHALPGALSAEGVPFEYTQSWLRHHVDGIAASSITSGTVQQVWLSRVATALDQVALSLGLRPIHGIAKKA